MLWADSSLLRCAADATTVNEYDRTTFSKGETNAEQQPGQSSSSSGTDEAERCNQPSPRFLDP